MARELNKKQQVALEVVRRHPEGISAQGVADEVPNEACIACGGTGDPQPRDHENARQYAERHPEYDFKAYAEKCGRCYGKGFRRFDYSMAYQALQALAKRGVVHRRALLDEWGDPVGGHIVYEPAAPDPDDPLEQAFHLPDAEEPAHG